VLLHTIVGISIVLVVGFLFYQVYQWRRGGAVSRREKVYKFAEAILMIVVLGMIFVGDQAVMARYGMSASTLPLAPRHLRVIVEEAKICYWLACFVFAVALMIVAMLDMREVREQVLRLQIDNLKGLIGPDDEKKRG
jgi:hypothetical protein